MDEKTTATIPGMPSFGINPFLLFAYYFGFPALVAAAMAIVLWSIVQNIEPRITEIETILAVRNTTVFAPLIDDNKLITANQDTIRRRQEDILTAINAHESDDAQQWATMKEINDAELRRLDDLFRLQPDPPLKSKSGALSTNRGR
jgi:hypothetical protein